MIQPETRGAERGTPPENTEEFDRNVEGSVCGYQAKKNGVKRERIGAKKRKRPALCDYVIAASGAMVFLSGIHSSTGSVRYGNQNDAGIMPITV